MSFDFDRIELVRDNLVTALLSWRNQHDDGLWRSTPDKASGTNPSFTCSSEAIQALTEAGQHKEAHISAERIDRAFFPNDSIEDLPFEATGSGMHIVNQAWATFVLQETGVRTGKNIWPAINKLIDQQESGQWYLVPKDSNNRVNSPIFNAYCIVALAEFVESQRRDSLLPEERILGEQLALVEACLINAVEQLKKSTVKINSENNYNWWPIRHSEKGYSGAPNFEVTLLCLHALTKAGRVLKNDFYTITAKSILDAVLLAVRKNNDTLEFSVEGEPVRLYDRFHDGSHNYFFCLYAPLCCVTILSYIRNELPDKSEHLIEVVQFFVEHILKYMPTGSLGKQGVFSSPETTEISTWATADAIIVLSRVLSHRAVLEKTDTAATIIDSSLVSPIVQTNDLGASDFSRFDNCVTIYCPLREERDGFFEDPDFSFQVVAGQGFWSEGEYNTQCAGEKHSSTIKLLMYHSSTMGRVTAAIDTFNFLTKIKPKLIISTGICGGFEQNDVRVGDIIVPKNVIDLAKRKIMEENLKNEGIKIITEVRPDPYNVDNTLFNFSNNGVFVQADWAHRCNIKGGYPKGRVPQLHTRDIVCSDEVVASEEWSSQISLDSWHLAGGVEMEAAGVLAAAKASGDVPVAVVKGVSDLANILKSDDNWRRISMYSTIEFLKSYFEMDH